MAQGGVGGAGAGMVVGTGVWGRKFTFSAVPSSRQSAVTVEVRRRAARDETGVDVAAAASQVVPFDYVRPTVTLTEIAADTAAVEYLGGYADPADVLRALAIVEMEFDEAVEKVNSAAATVRGGGGAVYSAGAYTRPHLRST